MQRQFTSFFSLSDWKADRALQDELAQLREDIAPTWLEEPLSIEDTAERYVRKELRGVFVDLCRKSVGEYLDRFGFKSDFVKAMYAVTDGFSGLYGSWDTSDLVEDVFALHPQKIEQHFGLTRGHIHPVDNSFGFADRLPYRTAIEGVYSASAGCHLAGSVIGAAGYNAAMRLMRDLGVGG